GGIDDGRTQEEIFAQNHSAQENNAQGSNKKGRAKALVAARYPRKRCARPEGWRVQADQRQENRGIAEAIGRTQLPPQIRRLPLGAIDAGVLYQSRRKEFAEDAARPARARER